MKSGQWVAKDFVNLKNLFHRMAMKIERIKNPVPKERIKRKKGPGWRKREALRGTNVIQEFPTRQNRRLRAFQIAFNDITKDFPGEPRMRRRRMARSRVRIQRQMDQIAKRAIA